jgi:hypothetical protein
MGKVSKLRSGMSLEPFLSRYIWSATLADCHVENLKKNLPSR